MKKFDKMEKIKWIAKIFERETDIIKLGFDSTSAKEIKKIWHRAIKYYYPNAS